MSIRLTSVSCGIHQLVGLYSDNVSDIIASVTRAFENMKPAIVKKLGVSMDDWRDTWTDSLWCQYFEKDHSNGVYPPCMFIFSDNDKGNRGERLMQFINNNPKYGTCTSTPWVPNTNSTKSIKLYTWILNPTWVRSFWCTRNSFYFDKVEKNETTKHEPAQPTAIPVPPAAADEPVPANAVLPVSSAQPVRAPDPCQQALRVG